MEELKEGIVKKLNKIVIEKICVVKNAMFNFSEVVFPGVFETLKKELISNFNGISQRKRKTYFLSFNFPIHLMSYIAHR